MTNVKLIIIYMNTKTRDKTCNSHFIHPQLHHIGHIGPLLMNVAFLHAHASVSGDVVNCI